MPPHLRITSCLFQPFSKVPPNPFPPPLFSTLLYIQSFTMICGKNLLPLCYDTSIRSPEEGFKNEIVLTAQTNGLSAWPLSLIFVTYHRHLVTDKRNTQIQIHLYKYTNTHTYKCTSYPPSLVCRFTGLWWLRCARGAETWSQWDQPGWNPVETGSRATRRAFGWTLSKKQQSLCFVCPKKMMIMGLDRALSLSNCYAGDGEDDTDRGGHNPWQRKSLT